jgi:hypothetical protein
MAINWTDVLLYGVPAYIAAFGGAIAAVIGARNGRKLNTTNGHTVGELVEDAHKIAKANADKLDAVKVTQGEQTDAANADRAKKP